MMKKKYLVILSLIVYVVLVIFVMNVLDDLNVLNNIGRSIIVIVSFVVIGLIGDNK